MTLHAVAHLPELPEGQGWHAQAQDHQWLLVRNGSRVDAYQAHCPHAGAPLADGAVCEGKLVCPWHKAVFDLVDGRLCEPPALDGLKRYPVWLDGDRVLVDDRPLEPAQRSTAAGDRRTFAIIGGGAAGTAAAAALREYGFGGRILLVDEQFEPGYDRTALSKFVLAGQMAAEDTSPLRDTGFYDSQRIERIQAGVVRIDHPARRLELSDGTTLPYHAVLLATGGVPQRLGVEGEALANIHALRSREDARQFMTHTQAGTRVVIVGEGFIGLEAASALRERGIAVSVAGRHPTPFAAQFGEAVGRRLRQLHEAHGVVFHVAGVQAFEGQTQVHTVMLDNGEQLPAEAVLVAAGVAPATAMLDGRWLGEDGAVIVDAGLQASEGLWAAGDIARFPLAGEATRIEHWRLAEQHGRLAAANMLGAQQAYEGVPFFWTYHFGKRLDYVGNAHDWDSEHRMGDLQALNFIQLLCQRGEVKAAVACEREAACAWLAERLKRPLPLAEALAQIKAMG
ncbi:FAD-dependent oxidoreductase [Pseudomonas typographi]|uniref:FAD-dependent oxidoreductase n=1 Tax=Pseudomonas typographi TaxID=2715964 RepID=UPI001684FCA7|nr:FAD-dependent oxidoreductase [Pseudomonas typographi]MBD1589533.1 FAD-dependent oxidoreductase [Pseudomonas typographi]